MRCVVNNGKSEFGEHIMVDSGMHDEIYGQVEGQDDLHAMLMRQVSSELRTPLTILKGYLELLNDGDLGELAPEQKEALIVIMNHVDEMETTVARVGVLMAAQTQGGLFQQFSISAIVAQMLEVQREQAAQQGIILSGQLASDLPMVMGDPLQLQVAMECLVDNAVKYTPNGGEVDVVVDVEDPWVRFSISDSGIGLSEQELAKLHRLFQKADGIVNWGYDGLSLDLAVVKRVVEMHSGEVEVCSELGVGSQFVIKLPAVASMTLEAEPVTPVERPKRILVVDDEEFVTFTLREGLEKLPNCEVVVTMSAEEALVLFEEQPYDLLITDYKMPDMNGVELASKIKQRYPHTRVIMVTAHSNYLLREPSAAAAVQRVLNKPVRLSEIRHAALETLNVEAEKVAQ